VGGWAALIAVLGLGYQWDAVQLWVGARALLAGGDPYQAVPASGFPWPLLYPLPAVLLATPFALLPETAARILWATATGAVFAYGARHRPPVLVAAVSAGFLTAVLLGQLVPAMLAGVFLPWLGFLWVAKPSVGLALFLAYPSRQAAIGCALFLLVSVAVMPDWPAHWLEAIATNDRKAPVLMPGGFLLLLGWLRWRTPEGRLLGSLALIPHGVYDALVLFLVARTTREGLGLAVLGMAGAVASALWFPWEYGGELSHPGRFAVAMVTVYLPALYSVLRRNSSQVPSRVGVTSTP
jgi:hypothetical protein